VCLLVQAETVTALRHLEAICAVDGVHGVFIGPPTGCIDGHSRQPRASGSAGGDRDAIRTIVASGKAAGTLTADAALARRYLELGASFVAVGIDATLLANAVRKLASDFGVGSEQSRAATRSTERRQT
jgi:4-hydroxy-2-oxoheptanedioate aldolase